MITLAKDLKFQAEDEPMSGRKSGLYAYSNAMKKDAYNLKEMLMDDRVAMLQFFGSINLIIIAKQELR